MIATATLVLGPDDLLTPTLLRTSGGTTPQLSDEFVAGPFAGFLVHFVAVCLFPVWDSGGCLCNSKVLAAEFLVEHICGYRYGFSSRGEQSSRSVRACL